MLPQHVDQACTDREQSVNVAGLFLAVSPHPGHGLLIVGGVPVGIKHHQAIGANQIQATSASLATEHEDELWILRDTELRSERERRTRQR